MTNPQVSAETMTLLENKNVGVNLCDPGSDKSFLDINRKDTSESTSIFLFVVRTLNMTSTLLTNFQVCNAALLTTGTYVVQQISRINSSHITETLY